MQDENSQPANECPTCGHGVLVESTRTLRETVGGRAFSREVPVHVCATCGEFYVSTLHLAALERQIADEVLAHGWYTPDAVVWVLDGYDLEPEVIGATWREVKAWARGEGEPSASVWPALVIAVEARRASGLASTGTGGE